MDYGKALASMAQGTIPAEIMNMDGAAGWANIEYGFLGEALMRMFSSTNAAGTLMETTAVAHALKDHFGLPAEAMSYLLGLLGRAKNEIDVSDLNAKGFPKVRYGKTCYSRLWGLPDDVEAYKEQRFKGTIRLGRGVARGAART